MASPDDSVPEPVSDRHENATGEISMLDPQEASKVAAEIRAVAESRGQQWNKYVKTIGIKSTK